MRACVRAGTCLAGLLVSSVQQQEPGGLGQEGERGQLEQGCEPVESQQPRPQLPSPEQLTAQGDTSLSVTRSKPAARLHTSHKTHVSVCLGPAGDPKTEIWLISLQISRP